jgi:hypothetical protein
MITPCLTGSTSKQTPELKHFFQPDYSAILLKQTLRFITTDLRYLLVFFFRHFPLLIRLIQMFCQLYVYQHYKDAEVKISASASAKQTDARV